MFWDKSSRAEKAVVIWALTLVSVALLVVLVALGSAVSDNSGNVASWVQAVGSIAAIVAGFGVAERTLKAQHEQQLARDSEAKRVKDRMQYFVIADRLTATDAWAKTVVEQLDVKNDDGEWGNLEQSARTVIDSLRDIAADQIPSAEAIHRVHLATVGVESVVRSMGVARVSKEEDKVQARKHALDRAKSVAAMALVDRKFCEAEAKRISTTDENLRGEEMRKVRNDAVSEALRRYQ